MLVIGKLSSILLGIVGENLESHGLRIMFEGKRRNLVSKGENSRVT